MTVFSFLVKLKVLNQTPKMRCLVRSSSSGRGLGASKPGNLPRALHSSPKAAVCLGGLPRGLIIRLWCCGSSADFSEDEAARILKKLLWKQFESLV